MEYLIIGLTVGMIMGLTGAGGALISIPLFIYFINASLKEATVLSLIAVIFGTLVNFFGQKHKVDRKVVALLVIFGTLSNYASLPLKKSLPDLPVAGLLFLIGVYSLWSVWQKKKAAPSGKDTARLLKTALIGMSLGVITTVTGLGGGVLLVPVLMSFYRKKYEEALPSSLLTILLISFFSLIFQLNAAAELINLNELALMGLGALSSVSLIKVLLKNINHHKVDKVRKVVFTLVVFYSVGSVLIKSL